MAQSSRQRRRISIYRLIEKQKSDLLDSGRHPLLGRSFSTQSGSGDESSEVNDNVQNLFFRVIRTPERTLIPTDDVVIVFSEKGSHIMDSLIDLLNHNLPQLTVKKKTFVKDASKTAFFISADDECLIQTAKLIGMIEDPTSNSEQEDYPIFRPPAQLTSQQRQTIIKYYLDSLRFFSKKRKGSPTPDLNGVVFSEGEAIFAKLSKLKMIECIFPLHSQRDLNYLRSSWVSSFFSSQPLDKIQEYFGLKIGMYFAFLGHYTLWLTTPSFLGVLIFTSGFFVSQAVVDLMTLFFSILIFLWSTLYLESLKTNCVKLAQKWSVKESEEATDKYTIANNSYGIRSSFMGEVSYDEDSDSLRFEYPDWKRQFTK